MWGAQYVLWPYLHEGQLCVWVDLFDDADRLLGSGLVSAGHNDLVAGRCILFRGLQAHTSIGASDDTN